MKGSVLEDFSAWAKEVDREWAGFCLVINGVHIDTAVRILNGTYTSEPKNKLREQIEDALRYGKKRRAKE